MEGNERDSIVFETDGGATMEFIVAHEFFRDGVMYAVLQREGSPGDTLIAEVSDPLGPEEEFIPLPMKRQEEMVEFLRRGNNEED